jgi:TonB family protein
VREKSFIIRALMLSFVIHIALFMVLGSHFKPEKHMGLNYTAFDLVQRDESELLDDIDDLIEEDRDGIDETFSTENVTENITELSLDSEQVTTSNSLLPEGLVTNNSDIKIEGPVSRRKLLYIREPKYPDWARDRGVEADVVVKFIVDPEGKVIEADVETLSGYYVLDDLAIKSVSDWIFEEMDHRLIPKNQRGKVVIQFRLE